MRGLALFLTLLFIGGCCARIDLYFIDSYDVGFNNIVIALTGTVTPTTNVSKTSFFTDPLGAGSPNILGGERDLQLTALTGTKDTVFSTSVSLINSTNGQWQIGGPPGGSASIEMQYDGIDGSINLDTTGFTQIPGAENGFDLTQGDSADGFHIQVVTDLTTEYNFFVYDVNGGISTNIQEVAGGDLLIDTTILFKDFTGTADFTKSGAIVVIVDGLPNVDTVTNLFTASGPEPSPTPSKSRTPSKSKKAASESNTASISPTPSKSRKVEASDTRTPSISVSRTRKAASESNTPSISVSRTRKAASESNTPSKSHKVPASESRTPSPSSPPSHTRTPGKSPSPSPIPPSSSKTNSPIPQPTCHCACPAFKCGLIYDRPGNDDDDQNGANYQNQVIYRPIYYYAVNHDFDEVEGQDDGESTFVVLNGKVAYFDQGVDDVPVYLFLSGGASTVASSMTLILFSLLVLVL